MQRVPDPVQRVPVRKLFWETLELALETQIHRLAKDVATALGQPEGPLLKALKEEKIKAYLFDEAEDQEVDDLGEFRCKDLIVEGPFLRRCCEPILWDSTMERSQARCLQHTLSPSRLEAKQGTPIVAPFSVDDAKYYICAESGAVYNPEGQRCGYYDKEAKRISLFTILEDD